MPHKHTRKSTDKSTVDLPPTEIAKPLPVSKSANSNGIFTTEINAKRNNKKRKRNKDAVDDTPRAFARLMAFQRGEKLPKGLDDGVKLSKAKKRKIAQDKEEMEDQEEGDRQSKKEKTQDGERELPTIRPGERMSDFAARVDAALPVGGLINKTIRGGKDPLGLKVSRTKTEKKMHRMYAEWREEERKIQEKKINALELAEEEEMDDNGQVKWKVDIESANAAKGRKVKKGKGKKKKVLGEVEDGDDDPWAKIKKDRAEKKVGLNDVVQAPPTFSRIPKEKFKVKGGARVDVGEVPKASGSLRRREELESVRSSVIEGYRQMMKERTKTTE